MLEDDDGDSVEKVVVESLLPNGSLDGGDVVVVDGEGAAVAPPTALVILVGKSPA